MAKKAKRANVRTVGGPGRRKAGPAAKKVVPIPPGVHTVTPYLSVSDAAGAIEFYARAFGARERMRLSAPDGKVMHAELKIGDSVVFLADEFPGTDVASPARLGGTTATIHLAVRNVDRAYERAIAAGAAVVMPLANMFWGDRFAKLLDPFGHSWSLAQQVEHVPPRELRRRMAAMFPDPAA